MKVKDEREKDDRKRMIEKGEYKRDNKAEAVKGKCFRVMTIENDEYNRSEERFSRNAETVQ